MALIACCECGKQISDRAQSCPYCGCPIENSNHSSGQIIIKAAQSMLPNGNTYTFQIELCTADGKVLCTLVPGETKRVNITKEIQVFVRPPQPKWRACNPGERSASQCITVFPNRITRLQVNYSDGFFVRRFTLSEVESIVSE